MDPITSALVGAIVKEVGKVGIQKALKNWDSEFGEFWKYFEANLKNDGNVPWAQIKGSRVTPQFVGIALSMVAGNEGAVRAFQDYFAELEPPEGPYESREWLHAHLLAVAERAASEAPKSDRLAALAAERRTKQAVAESEQRLHSRLDGLQKLLIERAATDEDLRKVLQSSKLSPETPSNPAPSNEQLEDQVEREFLGRQSGQHAENQERLRRLEEILEEVAARQPRVPAAPVLLAPDAPASAGPDGKPKALKADEMRIETLLGRLEGLGDPAAPQLRAALDAHGVPGIVGLLRATSEYSPAALDAIAGIVLLEGFHADAARAHRLAADRLDDPQVKAAELVAAAVSAGAAGAKEESAELLKEAKNLAPAHPALAIAEARNGSDGQLMLERLTDVEPESERQRAVLHATRARAHLLLNQLTLSKQEVELARAADPEHLAVKEVAAMQQRAEAFESAKSGNPDQKLFLGAGESYEALAEAIIPRKSPDDLARVLALAAQCLALADRRPRAIELLKEAAELEETPAEVRNMLAEAAGMCGDGELAAGFTDGPEGDPHSRIAWAESQLLTDSDSQAQALAVRLLEELLASEDEDVRAKAGFVLLAGSLDNSSVDWSERAAGVVGEHSPATLGLFRAQSLEAKGDLKGAEAELLAFGSDARALRLLRDYAARQENWTVARDRARELFKKSERITDRLALAQAIAQAGEPERARGEFLAVAHDESADESMRAKAFSGAVEIEAGARSYEVVRQLALEWHEALPEDSNAIWNLVFALARLARHPEAYTLVQKLGPDPDTPQRAALLAEVLSRAVPGETAIREIAALSDRYERKVEALEGILINSALTSDGSAEEVPEELVERVRESVATFPERFPDQQFMRVFEAPTTREGFENLLKEAGAQDRAKLQAEVLQEVIDGRQPVNTIAAIGPGDIGSAWLRLGFLPLGFAMDATDASDQEAAEQALGAAAVWDASSIFITGGLGRDHKATVRGLFPGSQIAIETLEDIDGAAATLPQREAGETVQDSASGEFLGIREKAEDEVARHRAMITGMLEVARELTVGPALDTSDPEVAAAYQENQTSWNAMVASLALAKSSGMPLFSDDRWIRQIAKSMGVPAFGSLALIKVMHAENVITSERRSELRQWLSAGFGWGVSPTSSELSTAVRESDGLLTWYLRGALNDRAAWRATPGTYMRELVAMLSAVCESEEGDVRLWVRRILEGFAIALPELSKVHASETLLLFAWDIDGSAGIPDGCFREILDEVTAISPYFFSVADAPAIKAISSLLEVLGSQPKPIRSQIFMQVIGRLGFEDQLAAIQYFTPGSTP